MNARRCQRIADRIHSLLMHELGAPIDTRRMLADTLYARDVLLVCDAHHGSDLSALSQHFRVAAAESAAAAEDSAQPSAWGAPSTTGFGASSTPTSLSDFDSLTPTAVRPPRDLEARRRSWLSPARWLGGDN